MIQKLSVKNYQSLKDVTMTLGKFTVIVGPSNSGKSALLRSLTALASNERGTEAIRLGASSYSITADTGDAIVTLERGKVNQYKISRNGNEEVFTKLNGKVPEEVTKALGIAPVIGGKSINYASQHEAPFLLEASAGEVARVLGELTGINKIFEAVKEANKRKGSYSSIHKTRVADLEKTVEALTQFSGLPGQVAELKELEAKLANIQQLEDSIYSLQDLVTQIAETEQDIELCKTVTMPPSLDRLRELYDRLVEYSSLLKQFVETTNSEANAQQSLNATRMELENEKQRLKEHLHDYGFCPLCEKEI